MAGPTSDGTVPGRTVGDSRWSTYVEWVLLTGNRTLVAIGIAGLFATFFLVLEAIGAFPLSDRQIVSRLFQALIVGNITLVTVIVSINQLLLTRELQAPGELRTQMADVVDYRRDARTGTVALNRFEKPTRFYSSPRYCGPCASSPNPTSAGPARGCGPTPATPSSRWPSRLATGCWTSAAAPAS